MQANHECGGDGTDYHGQCLGECCECGAHLESTGRYTVYCPSCDCCPECLCPNVDGFAHYAGCKAADDDDKGERVKCDTCDAEEFISGEITSKTLEDDGWYLGPTISLCPDHNEETEDEQ